MRFWSEQKRVRRSAAYLQGRGRKRSLASVSTAIHMINGDADTTGEYEDHDEVRHKERGR